MSFGGEGDNQLDLDFLGDEGLKVGGEETTEETNTVPENTQSQQATQRQPDTQNTQQRTPAATNQQQKTNTNQQQQPQQTNAQQQQQPTGPLRPLTNTGFFTDNRGNVLDKEGHVVASAGRERRLWQDNQRSRGHIGELTAELTRLRTANETSNTLGGLPRQLGLSNDEVRESMTIVSQFKADPIKAAQDILARVRALGYTNEQILGRGAPGGIDTAAVNRMIEQKLEPFTQKETQRVTEQRTNIEVQQAYNTFMDRHEYADVHEDAIVKLLQARQAAGTPLSLEQAYYAIREFAIRNNMDFTIPLGPQVEERSKGVQQQANPNPQNNQQRRTVPSAPNGFRSAPAAVAQVQDRPENYGDSDDWKAIIRREATLAGVNG